VNVRKAHQARLNQGGADKRRVRATSTNPAEKKARVATVPISSQPSVAFTTSRFIRRKVRASARAIVVPSVATMRS
jgi:hypothetical protein